jgi:hypothetical protein
MHCCKYWPLVCLLPTCETEVKGITCVLYRPDAFAFLQLVYVGPIWHMLDSMPHLFLKIVPQVLPGLPRNFGCYITTGKENFK